MASFEKSSNLTLRHEGGVINNPSDHGGLTKFGISKKSYPELDIGNLAENQALQIYYKDYWLPIQGDLITDQEVADKIFDCAVNCGVRIASRNAQRAAIECTGYQITIDGIIGPKTLELVNQSDPKVFLDHFRKLMLEYYESLNQPEFIRGWKIRLYSQ